MGSPEIVLTPILIQLTREVTESACLDAATYVVALARLLATRHGLFVAIARTGQLGWALNYALI